MKVYVAKSLTFFRVRMNFSSGSREAWIGHPGKNKGRYVGSMLGGPKYLILGLD